MTPADIYSSLSHQPTPQQKAIAESEDQNIFSLASAGSGKTTTIVFRILYLIKALRVRPESIILFSFSRSATHTIRQELTQALGENTVRKMTISTFHAYAYQIVKDNASTLDIKPDELSLIGNAELESLLKTTAQRLHDRGSVGRVITTEDLPSLMTGYRQIRTQGGKFAGQLFHQKILSDCISYMDFKSLYTFDDLLFLTDSLFSKHKDVADRYASAFSHMILDEAQDTSPKVFDILYRLLTKEHHFMCTGDIQQLLYGFLGCSPRKLIQFSKDRKCVIHRLDETFRFGPSIAKVANSIVNDLSLEEEYKLRTQTTQKSKPVTFHPISKETIGKTICDQITAWRDSGVNYDQMYIIARTNRELISITQELLRAGIPAVNRGEGFLQRREIKHILSALQIIKSCRRDDWLTFINPYPVGIDAKMVGRVFANFSGTLDQMETFIRTIDISGIGPKRKEEFIQLITYLKAVEGMIKTEERLDFRAVARALHLNQTTYMTTNEKTREGESIVEERWKFIDALSDLSQSLAAPPMNIAEHIKLSFDVPVHDQSNAVTLQTAHRSKGMTLPYVIVSTQRFFSFAKTEQEIQWEKYALYVSATRAKEQLVFLVDPNRAAARYAPKEWQEAFVSQSSQAGTPSKTLRSLATGKNHPVPIYPTKVIDVRPKAVHLQIKSRRLWFPRSAISTNEEGTKVFAASWIAEQHNL
jgi:DNA helicase-2/ATP-dependent DNA helicase PcrA